MAYNIVTGRSCDQGILRVTGAVQYHVNHVPGRRELEGVPLVPPYHLTSDGPHAS